jgi:hypothetical protein
MPSVNPGPATTQTPNQVAQLLPVNTLQKPVEVGTNALRLLAVARNVNLAVTGDVAVMPIINSAQYAPASVVTANGQVNGVAGSIATASLGIFTGAASTGSTIKTQVALAANSAALSSIVIAANSVILALTAQTLFVNVGTALAGATCDVFVYGYDQT